MSFDTKRTFPALSSSNWGQWSDNMEAYLATKELWEYVDGSTPQPVPADTAHPNAAEKKELAEWKRKAAKASGEIWLALEDNQKVHVKASKGDPAAMWKALEAVHLQKRPNKIWQLYKDFRMKILTGMQSKIWQLYRNFTVKILRNIANKI
jgi:hypothetical protein